MAAKTKHLALLAAAIALAPAIWRAGPAAVPAPRAVTGAQAGWLTASVQAGFVAGPVVSALFAPAERWDARALFLGAAQVAAAGTAAPAFLEPAGAAADALRFLAGAPMAGIYPVGMKPAAGWAKGDLGLLIGLVVGALTVGSAAPHLMPAALGTFDWRAVYLAALVVAAVGGLLILPFRPGPLEAKRPPFKPSQALEACGTSARAWPISATSATFGSSTRCGPGWGCSLPPWARRAAPRQGC